MKKIILFHNPRWSKSRESVQILNSLGLDYEIIDYMKIPPSQDKLKEIGVQLQLKARDFIRKTEKVFAELHLEQYIEDEHVLYEQMSKHPKLIERPIVIYNNKAVIGRPPEKIKDFLNDL